MTRFRKTLRLVREYWLIIVAVLVNLAIAGPVAADWNNDICIVGNRIVQCCTDCTFFCACGESPAP
jgi:hypothetical protein